MGIVKYNGISTSDLGLIVQSIPSYSFSEKDVTFEHISGRNGDLLLNNNSYKNTTRTYYLAKVFRKGEQYISSVNAITEWLHSADTYVRLEDSYEPDYYRMAIFKNEGTLPNHYNQATTIEVNFDCKPQKWLKIGDDPIDIVGVTNLKNPTNYDSLPIIEFDIAANTEATITIGNNVMIFKQIESADHIIIDCENMECYSQTANYNKYLKLNSFEFPVLNKKDITQVSITNVTNAIIKPRWWTL